MKIFKFLFIVLFLCMTNINVIAQSYNSNKVALFADYLSKWTNTHNQSYRFDAEELCNGTKKVIVCDEFSHILARNNNAPIQKTYELDTYLNGMEKFVRNKTMRINYSDIRKISMSDVISDTKLSNKDMQEMMLFSCKINVSGDIQHEAMELFYVYKNKIAKIGKYEKKKGKIMVDFNDFINNHGTFGFSYNYGQHFPVGGSFNGSFEDIPLMISIDFGINFDNDKHIIDKVNMQDIMNYDREKKELDTKFFVTVTPQAYFNYFAIGCGFGFLYMDGTSDYTRYSSSSASNTSASTSSSSNAYLIKPMIRPVIKGFIPFSYEDYYISISVGYDWVLGYKKKNGFNVGIGIQCSL